MASGKIVSLDKVREARSPHMTGKAVCLDCRHEWVAVMPVTSDTTCIGAQWLECPECTLERGRFRFHTTSPGLHWTCNCGCDLFFVTDKHFYCPNCGAVQRM